MAAAGDRCAHTDTVDGHRYRCSSDAFPAHGLHRSVQAVVQGSQLLGYRLHEWRS